MHQYTQFSFSVFETIFKCSFGFFVLFFCACFCFKTGSCCGMQAGLELLMLLTQSLECWDYRYVPPCLAMFSGFYKAFYIFTPFCWFLIYLRNSNKNNICVLFTSFLYLNLRLVNYLCLLRPSLTQPKKYIGRSSRVYLMSTMR
jgi:hypothetical protein